MDPNLLKRARKKYLSTRLAAELVKLRSSLHVGYRNTLACSHQLEVDDDQVLRSTFYCRRRWCSTCASINMATLIDRYRPSIVAMSSPMFVTLTVPNCSSPRIDETLDRMAATWRKITDLARKRRILFRGIRKTELKVGKGGGFHPHYHLILDGGQEAAEWLVDQWLERIPEASRLSQDIAQVSDIGRALVELMKYATKLTCAEDSRNLVLATPRQMDRIFRAVHGRRLVQPFGGIKAVPDDAFDPEPQIVEAARGLYNWCEADWYHVETGEALTGYDPRPDLEEWQALQEEAHTPTPARHRAAGVRREPANAPGTPGTSRPGTHPRPRQRGCTCCAQANAPQQPPRPGSRHHTK